MKGKWALKAAKMVGLLVVGSLAIGLVVMLLWNALIPGLFHGPVLTFWQAVGLLILSHILLRGWGHRGHGWRHDRWRHRFEERLASMTPEERDKFREEWRHRCGWMPGKPDVKSSS